MHFDFKTRNKIAGLGVWGCFSSSFYYLYLLILRLYTDFLLLVYPGTGRKDCGGGGLRLNLNLLLWSKPFPSGLSFGIRPSRTPTFSDGQVEI